MNIKPKNIHPKYNRYRLGAATADPKDLDKPVSEGKDSDREASRKALKRTFGDKINLDKKSKPDPKVWKKMPALSKLLGVKEGITRNNPIVAEAFKAAIEKKKKPVDKPEKLEVKGPGANDKFQADPVVTPLTSTFTRTP